MSVWSDIDTSHTFYPPPGSQVTQRLRGARITRRRKRLVKQRFRGLIEAGRHSNMALGNSVKVTLSSANVFRDLGFSAEEADHLLIRADLLIQVQKLIASRRLKQAAVAKLLRVS
jgi:hypothetical protein